MDRIAMPIPDPSAMAASQSIINGLRLTFMNSRQLRWGILSTAHIARKNWKAIQLADNSIVTAVASRDLERSRRFIAECQAEAPMAEVPRAFGSYQELLDNREVDAVYIPLPTGLRKEWVIKAAQAGKHVVSEKPCAVSVADLRHMVEACQSHGVQFMDGVMFMHSRRLDLLRQVLNDGQSVGEARRMASSFAFGAPEEFFGSNIRTHSQLEPFGSLGDLGWYCIRFALWLKNWQMPREVTGRLLAEYRRADCPAAVPTAFSGELWFDDGFSASYYCSFLSDIEQWVRISGLRGCLEMQDFVLPLAGDELGFTVQHLDFKVNGTDFRMETRDQRFTVKEHSHGHSSAQEANLFRNFAAQAMSGQLNPSWPEAALKTQIVMNACFDSAQAGGEIVKPSEF